MGDFHNGARLVECTHLGGSPVSHQHAVLHGGDGVNYDLFDHGTVRRGAVDVEHAGVVVV